VNQTRKRGEIMDNLLLTDGQLELAATGFDFGECKPEWRRVAKAQATKAVTGVFERIEGKFNLDDIYRYDTWVWKSDLRNLLKELLGEEKGL